MCRIFIRTYLALLYPHEDRDKICIERMVGVEEKAPLTINSLLIKMIINARVPVLTSILSTSLLGIIINNALLHVRN